MNSNSQGKHAENFACRFLEQQGLILIQKNFRTKMGEIDLIMRDGPAVVFVEVRYRKHSHFGGCAESIDIKKQQKLIKSASCYLQSHRALDQIPARFDLVFFDGEMKLHWVKNAFEG